MTLRTLFALLAAALPLLAAETKFRAASGSEPVIGRYVVTLADHTDLAVATAALVRAYGGRLEPFAAENFHGFAVAMAPARARALSNDPRVVLVEERPGGNPEPVAALLATVPGSVKPAWTTEATLWKSGVYQYDSAGNIAQIDADVYRYDGAGRLTYATANPPLERIEIKSAVAPNSEPAAPLPPSQTFTYDRYGNLTRVKTSSQAGTFSLGFHVDAMTNRLGTGVCASADQACISGVYDESGNQTGSETPDEYVWDELDMLTEVRSARRERYLYDANDERIAALTLSSGKVVSRHYTLRNLDRKIAREVVFDEAAGKWSFARDYVYRGGVLIAAFNSETATHPDRHYHVDHLGSTRLITDGIAYKKGLHTYWPFGAETPDHDANDGERLKFTGHERDSSPTSPGFDLDYMHARYYSPGAGRFLSVDPTWASADVSQPQSWNRYAYVMNNPIGSTDPDGRCGIPKGCQPDPAPSTRQRIEQGGREFLQGVTNASTGAVEVGITVKVGVDWDLVGVSGSAEVMASGSSNFGLKGTYEGTGTFSAFGFDIASRKDTYTATYDMQGPSASVVQEPVKPATSASGTPQFELSAAPEITAKPPVPTIRIKDLTPLVPIVSGMAKLVRVVTDTIGLTETER